MPRGVRLSPGALSFLRRDIIHSIHRCVHRRIIINRIPRSLCGEAPHVIALIGNVLATHLVATHRGYVGVGREGILRRTDFCILTFISVYPSNLI